VRRARGEGGAVMVLTVVSMVMVLGATALSVDIGRLVSRNRDLQAVSDSVALDAVTLLDGEAAGQVAGAVDQEALAAAERNGFTPATLADSLGHSTPEGGPGGSVLNVTFGVWTPPGTDSTTTSTSSTTVAPGGEGTFAAVTDPTVVPNALQVQAGATLGGVFVHGSSPLSRAATADDPTEAGATLGSWLGSFDGTQVTVLNGLLSTLNGVYDTSAVQPSVYLTAAGYQGLADASVQLGDIASADPSIGTVDNLLSGTYSPGVLTTDLAEALDHRAQRELQNGDVSASTNLEQASVTVGNIASLVTADAGIDVCKMLSVGAAPPPPTGPSFTCAPTDPAAASATVNVLRFEESVAELALADGQNGFYVDLGVGSKVLLRASVVQAAQEMAPCAPGPACTVQTDQVGASLQVQLDPTTSLQISSSAADAQATLTSVTCAGGNQYPDTSAYAVTTTGATLTASVSSALGTFGSEGAIPGTSGTLSWAQTDPPPPVGQSVFTPADGQTMSSQQVPVVSFPTFSPPLPLGLAGEVTGLLDTVEPLVPDVLTALGVSIEGATLTSWPVVCSAPELVR
jgi:uncharacterized membrane protein